jgi:hypothetical protein
MSIETNKLRLTNSLRNAWDVEVASLHRLLASGSGTRDGVALGCVCLVGWDGSMYCVCLSWELLRSIRGNNVP